MLKVFFYSSYSIRSNCCDAYMIRFCSSDYKDYDKWNLNKFFSLCPSPIFEKRSQLKVYFYLWGFLLFALAHFLQVNTQMLSLRTHTKTISLSMLRRLRRLLRNQILLRHYIYFSFLSFISFYTKVSPTNRTVLRTPLPHMHITKQNKQCGCRLYNINMKEFFSSL